MAKKSDVTLSVSVGPQVPLEVVNAALKIVKSRTPAADGQADIEDVTGRNPDNERKAMNIAGTRLLSIIERIERLDEVSGDINARRRDIFSEAKSAGFDVKVLRQLIRIRKAEPAEVEEQETLLDVYRNAIGM